MRWISAANQIVTTLECIRLTFEATDNELDADITSVNASAARPKTCTIGALSGVVDLEEDDTVIKHGKRSAFSKRLLFALDLHTKDGLRERALDWSSGRVRMRAGRKKKGGPS